MLRGEITYIKVWWKGPTAGVPRRPEKKRLPDQRRTVGIACEGGPVRVARERAPSDRARARPSIALCVFVRFSLLVARRQIESCLAGLSTLSSIAVLLSRAFIFMDCIPCSMHLKVQPLDHIGQPCIVLLDQNEQQKKRLLAATK